jgi:hypothetical protein
MSALRFSRWKKLELVSPEKIVKDTLRCPLRLVAQLLIPLALTARDKQEAVILAEPSLYCNSRAKAGWILGLFNWSHLGQAALQTRCLKYA